MVTQTQSILNLSLNEERAVREFLTKVRIAFGGKVERAALFGSKVRGKSTEYSDIDILLIVTDDDWKFKKAIIGIGSDVSLDYDILMDIRIISKNQWEYLAAIQAGLYQNIVRDAIALEWELPKAA